MKVAHGVKKGMKLQYANVEKERTAAAEVGQVHICMPLFAQVHSNNLAVLWPEYAHPEISCQHVFEVLHCPHWRQGVSHGPWHRAPAQHLLIQL